MSTATLTALLSWAQQFRNCSAYCPPPLVLPLLMLLLLGSRVRNHWRNVLHLYFTSQTKGTREGGKGKRKRQIVRTWCNAVMPSTFAVLISAPCLISCTTSSLSPDRQAARKTHPELNLMRRHCSWRGVGEARFVSDSSQCLSWAARFFIAESLRMSSADIFSAFCCSFSLFIYFNFSFVFFFSVNSAATALAAPAVSSNLLCAASSSCSICYCFCKFAIENLFSCFFLSIAIEICCCCTENFDSHYL